jgi:pyruvate/2-oxoglutarate dehydrogenase complex dihydrolipoamide acyltransferase (E2) component
LKVATPISIPKLGVAVTEGYLVEWSVPDGASVSIGEGLYVLETEKAETTIEAPATGIVRIHQQAGQTFPVGTTIGQIE